MENFLTKHNSYHFHNCIVYYILMLYRSCFIFADNELTCFLKKQLKTRIWSFFLYNFYVIIISSPTELLSSGFKNEAPYFKNKNNSQIL